ncbi:hypothetical protein [Cellulomonas hominis]
MSELYVLSADERHPWAVPTHDHPVTRRVLGNGKGRLQDPPQIGWTWPAETDPPDVCGTIDMMRLFSPKARDVLQANAGEADEVQWLDSDMTTADGRHLTGWSVLYFPTPFDLLSERYTTWGPSGLPIRWVLSVDKCRGHQVFVVPGTQMQTLITRPVLDALTQADLTGFTATPARTDD